VSPTRNNASHASAWFFHVTRPPRNEMHMAVKDCLARALARVDADVEPCDVLRLPILSPRCLSRACWRDRTQTLISSAVW